MKSFTYLQLVFALLIAMVAPAMPAVAYEGEPVNLINNHSAEIAEGEAPQSWSASNWGTNEAIFTYQDGGYDGAKSLRTEVTSYTDGDAKWYPTPVSVESDTEYVFSEHYRSSVSTEVVIQYTLEDTTNSYLWLQTTPVSTDWAYIEHTFTTPANATQFTMFHVVNGVGWLEVDDYSLIEVFDDPVPTGDNLIANSSLEDNSDDLPLQWLSNNWGTNTADFTYADEGNTGVKSVKSQVTSYTDGDAKWYFEPVAVEAGKIYEYSHYYKSDITTELVIQYQTADNAASYVFMGFADPSAVWNKFETEILVPSNVVKMSMFHVVAGVGELSIDDARLVEKTDGEEPSVNPVPNPSLESSTANLPTQWVNNSWGDNTTSFEYLNEGRTGASSVKITMSDYANGDGKWYFSPVSLTQGQEYQFSAWYKTDTIPAVVAMHELPGGVIQYNGLPTPQPASNSATNWQHYSETFTVPTEAVSTSVFMLVNSNGWLQTDDYGILPYQAEGFNRALVTLTFDDGHEDNTTTALPIMQSHGFLSTQCYATTYIEDAEDEQIAINSVLQFRDAGHEICSHTVTHPFLTQLSATDATHELEYSQDYLQAITGEPVRNFASPYGDYNAPVNDIIDDFYQSHRTVDAGYNAKNNFDIYRLKVQNMLDTTTIGELQGWLDQAQATNTWLILVYHRVADDPGRYDTYTSDFTVQMQALADSGLTVKTYDEALSELLPQL